SRVIGRSIANVPPYAYGYNPYPSPVINTAPVYTTPYVPPVSGMPYATLSTSPYGGSTPYGATLAANQGAYSLSTTGGSGGLYANDNYGGGYGGGYGYGYSGLGNTGGTAAGYGLAIQGLASYTQAQGNYQIQIR